MAPGILGTTKAFNEALKCMNTDEDVERSDAMPLVDVPYEVGEQEPAADIAKRLERETQELQDFLDSTLKVHEAKKGAKRSRADAETLVMSKSAKIAEQIKLAKAEADKLGDLSNKQVIYDRIDQYLME